MDHSSRNQAFHLRCDAPLDVTATAGEASFLAPRAPETSQIETARINEIIEVLRRGERFLVCSHSRPDGDAVGSMLAIGMLLAQMGKRADLVAADRIPNIYREVPGA